MLVELEGGTGDPSVDTLMRKYTWGLDLAGLTGSAGVSPARNPVKGCLQPGGYAARAARRRNRRSGATYRSPPGDAGLPPRWAGFGPAPRIHAPPAS